MPVPTRLEVPSRLRQDLLQMGRCQPEAGSHKTNTAIPQAYYNMKAGMERIATETRCRSVGIRAGICNHAL